MYNKESIYVPGERESCNTHILYMYVCEFVEISEY